ncbi:MAG: FGGY family carbohydrate kinase [Bacteroidota bacterium]
MSYLLGYDLGSSSIKAALIDAKTQEPLTVVQSPETEMEIAAPQADWAEQEPEVWWQHICQATQKVLIQTGVDADQIKGIGISYQMHGLVLVDKDHQVIRPSIIWCDSRAVEIGNQAFQEIGKEKALSHLLNSPGNFTASKLKWVKENEPDTYAKIHKIMLPGDYIAMRLTGQINTTASGLSEGILWDFQEEKLADLVLEHYGFQSEIVPNVVPTFSLQGHLQETAAKDTGLTSGIPVTYRAGDQPNNALSLNVLQPGEVAATGGTSGVVYGIVDQVNYDSQSRVNGFAHVNHSKEDPRIGILLCINGAGIQYNWMRQNVAKGLSYQEMNKLAASVPVGSDGLQILPFGNGAERMLCNKNIGARIQNMNFNRHTQAHLCRASLEGIAFSFVYGVHILKAMGLEISVMRVGNDNLFRSKIFAQTIANLLDCKIELIETTGAVGAAKAAGVATGIYASVEKAMKQVGVLKVFEPEDRISEYRTAYDTWEKALNTII